MTAAAILQGVWDESGGRISVDEAVQKCRAKRVDAAELQRFATFAKQVAGAVATTEDMEESKRMETGGVESAPAATAMEAVSKYAGVFEQVLDSFLTKNGILKSKIKVDFSTCATAFDAITAVTDVYNKGQRVPKIPGGDVVKLHQLLQAAVDAFGEKTDETPALLADEEDLKKAFKSKYIGGAHDKLFNFLGQCWETYRTNGAVYRYPYFAIVQSSGFGKTRLLRELGERFKVGHETRHSQNYDHYRLVYVNVRDGNSSGYPKRTDKLARYFFTKTVNETTNRMVRKLASRLVDLFETVMPPEESASSDQASPSQDGLMKLFEGDDDEFVQQLGLKLPEALKHATSANKTPKPRRVLVFAVDEARALLPTPDEEGIGCFRALRRALELANGHIQESSPATESGIFGIVVDTNSKISNVVPPAILDSSQRRYHKQPLVLFPPFVLTHTMDVLHKTKLSDEGNVVQDPDASEDPLKRYQNEVENALKKDLPNGGRTSWMNLRKLGRPLWLQMEMATRDNRDKLVEFAAQKLLRGKLSTDDASFNDETLNGVASMLCRVGIRPYASTPLAAGMVADFMAVLSYVGYTSETFVASYSSDPILTLGATCVWHHRGCGVTLAKMILPQLRKLMHQEVMETGGIGEMVARIVLLLAMDACHLLEREHPAEDASHWSGAGEFFSVWTFLTALQGDEPGLFVVNEEKVEAERQTKRAKVEAAETEKAMQAEAKAPALQKDATSGATKTKTPNVPDVKITKSMLVEASPEQARAACAVVEARWKDWFVSFTHFVQLAQVPSEACLWAMLGRRAAGIMPRNQKGVDLVIPICTPAQKGATNGRVSMIFVQVKNVEQEDPAFPSSATVKMHPSSVFVKTDSKESATGGEPVKSGKRRKESLDPEEEKKQREREEETARFAALGPDSVLRVYMSLRGKHERMQRFYLEDKCADGGETSYVLCLKGLEPTSSRVLGKWCEQVPVLTPAVVDELEKLLPPWWKVKTLVEQDVRCRDNDKSPCARFGLPMRELVELALKPTAENVLLNSDEFKRIPAGESALGRVTSR